VLRSIGSISLCNRLGVDLVGVQSNVCPLRAAAKKSGKSGGLQDRIKKAAGFVARTHRFLAVRFRYGLSSGSWNLQ
jgi:hypothetical protein